MDTTSASALDDFTRSLAAPSDPDWSLAPQSNAPQSPNYFTSTCGGQQKLHFRVFLPPSTTNVKATLFYFHGYGLHNNTVPKARLGNSLADRGVAVIMPDLLGHGFSEVRTRATAFFQRAFMCTSAGCA
jgi:alpha-beta hydrolase superfamily lysophospholipase